jgi:hypothetical protein
MQRPQHSSTANRTEKSQTRKSVRKRLKGREGHNQKKKHPAITRLKGREGHNQRTFKISGAVCHRLKGKGRTRQMAQRRRPMGWMVLIYFLGRGLMVLHPIRPWAYGSYILLVKSRTPSSSPGTKRPQETHAKHANQFTAIHVQPVGKQQYNGLFR